MQMSTDDIARKLAEKIDAEMMRIITAGYTPPRRNTALRLSPGGGGEVEVVELDDAGNVIERCRKCGPILMCADCMARVT